jgi:hypothetical protein
MPRLREYVTVGICSGYGDGDYRVSLNVGDLSVHDMNELRKAFTCAIFEAERIWRDSQQRNPEHQAKAATVLDSQFAAPQRLGKEE